MAVGVRRIAAAAELLRGGAGIEPFESTSGNQRRGSRGRMEANASTSADRVRTCAARSSSPPTARGAGQPQSAGRRRDRRADGRVLGEGFHAELGGAHAEVAAIADAREPRRRLRPARRCT